MAAKAEAEAKPVINPPPAGWSALVGKPVMLIGTRPQMVLQHPLVGGPGARQTYLNVGERQIVLLNEPTLACEAQREVTGILSRIDLGGRPNTKGSYKGWSLAVSKVSCSKAP